MRGRRQRSKKLFGRWIRSGMALLAVMTALPGWCSQMPVACAHGRQRIGTIRDALLGRQWAVILNCAHPGWPARLEPSQAWPSLPAWVPAGTKIQVHAGSADVSMLLSATTVMPAAVGARVLAQLPGGARVAVRLTGPQQAVLLPRRHWGEP